MWSSDRHPRRHLALLSIVVIVATGFVLLGCESAVPKPEKASPEPDPAAEPPSSTVPMKIADNVKVVPSGTAISHTTADTVSFVNPVDYRSGDVLVIGVTDQTPNGMLRKVVSVSTDQRTLTTEMATIVDAIEEGGFSATTRLDPDSATFVPAMEGVRSIHDPISAGTLQPAISGVDIDAGFYFSVQLDDAVLYDIDGNQWTTNDQIVADGRVYFQAAIDLGATIRYGALQDAHFRVALDEEFELTVTSNILANQSLPSVIGPIELGSYAFRPPHSDPTSDSNRGYPEARAVSWLGGTVSGADGGDRARGFCQYGSVV